MNSNMEQICRLCLKVAKNGFREIDGTMKQLFDILLLKLDLELSRYPIICQDCAEVAKKCLNFKSICIDRERNALSFSAGRRISKQNIKFIYAENEQVVIVNNEDFDICRFCISRLERFNCVPVGTLLKETMFEITKYMPEMDFNVPQDPIICTTCRKNLEGYSRFVLNCLDTETKIKSYCKEHKSDKGLINLDDVLEILFKDPIEYQIHEIKQESNRTEDAGSMHHKADIVTVSQEELDIKDEDETKHKMYFKKHTLVHTDISKINMFKCALCAYETKRKRQLTNHMLVHKDISGIKMFKCALCTFEGKTKKALKWHMLVHKDVSEVKMFKCASCAYETKRKGSLQTHMLIHKDVSEIKMFKCSLCSYEAKQKRYIDNHMLIHKNVSEIKMYKCALCGYESKTKGNLGRHMLVHEDVSEIKMYKCSFCAYESKSKSYLVQHMGTHKDVSEIKMYKCALCAYVTKKKEYLKGHMLVHKDVSEIKMHKCTFCAFEAKNRNYLVKHMLIHMDASEIKMFKCTFCSYQAKQKRYIKKHMLIHENGSKTK